MLGPIDLTLSPGESLGVIGPNGAGKSTLLRLMAGLLSPGTGRVTLDGVPLGSITVRQRAQAIAFLPQHPPSDIDATVRDVVLMGRFPHRDFGLFESAEDARIATAAMRATGVDGFADRPIRTLSGGEAQRVHLAAAFAQQPRILLLDEPTAALDLHHQLAIFHILRERTTSDGLAAVIVTHDVNLAGQYCDRVLLLHEGHAVALGRPRDVLTAQNLAPVYRVHLTAAPPTTAGAIPWLIPDTRADALGCSGPTR